MALKTPVYNLNDYPNVYEPREDTFLFIDALEADQQFIKDLNPKCAVEIGSGSGVVITALSSILNNSCTYFATDINIDACKATQLTSILNHTQIECVNSDLLQCFKPNFFDMILFNPPYVVTNDEEIIGTGLNRAWAGGTNGRVIIDKVLGKLSCLLSNQGVCYMVLLKENNPEEILKILEKRSIDGKLVLARRVIGEHLFVYKFFQRKL